MSEGAWVEPGRAVYEVPVGVPRVKAGPDPVRHINGLDMAGHHSHGGRGAPFLDTRPAHLEIMPEHRRGGRSRPPLLNLPSPDERPQWAREGRHPRRLIALTCPEDAHQFLIGKRPHRHASADHTPQH